MKRALALYVTLAGVPIGLGGHEDPISEIELIIVERKEDFKYETLDLIYYLPSFNLRA